MIRGTSYTIDLIFNAEYDVTRVKDIRLTIGNYDVCSLADGISNSGQHFLCSIPSDVTAVLPAGERPVTLTMEDATDGVRKAIIATIPIQNTGSQYENENVSETANMTLELTYMVNNISADLLITDVTALRAIAAANAAKDSEDATKVSEDNAKQSETNAAQSESDTLALKNTVQGLHDTVVADAAQVALDRIATGEDAAQTALDRIATGQDAQTATTKAGEASSSAAAALQSKNYASGYADDALASKNASALSASEALAYRNAAAAIVSGGPKGVYANLAALIAANPDHAYTYLTSDNGYWNYWNGSAFVGGAVYQTTATDAVVNVTALIPLSAGSYYTLYTALDTINVNRASLKKIGFEMTFAASSVVWWTYKFIGATLADWYTTSKWIKISPSEINVTEMWPLGAGVYYTLTTAIAAVPTHFQKNGLKLTFRVSSGVWQTWQYNGASGSFSTLWDWDEVTEKGKAVNQSILDSTFTFYDKDGVATSDVLINASNGVYLGLTGTRNYGAAAAITPPVPVIGGVTYYYIGDNINASVGQCFYDADGVFISSVAGNPADRYGVMTLLAPSNARTLVCSCLAGSLNRFRLYTKEPLHKLLVDQLTPSGVLSSVPTKIPIVVGNKLQLFKHSIVKAINPDNYYLQLKKVTGTAKGYFYDRVFEYTPVGGDANFGIKFLLEDDNYRRIHTSTELTIVPTTKKTSPAANKNILAIGDSFTAYNYWLQEFSRRLKGTGGTPVADNLSNLTFIGTKNTGVGEVRCEAVGGKDYPYFNSNLSPFYNSGTSQIDITNYCTVNGYSGVDYAIIILGTNGGLNTNTEAQIRALWDKLIAHNPSIKILVGGRILPAPYGGPGSAEMANNQTFYGLAKDAHVYNRFVETLSQHTDYVGKVFFADILPGFDIMNNMPYSEVDANNRNSVVKVRQGTDNVHPALSGYYQIADIMYNAFHYFCLI